MLCFIVIWFWNKRSRVASWLLLPHNVAGPQAGRLQRWVLGQLSASVCGVTAHCTLSPASRKPGSSHASRGLCRAVCEPSSVRLMETWQKPQSAGQSSLLNFTVFPPGLEAASRPAPHWGCLALGSLVPRGAVSPFTCRWGDESGCGPLPLPRYSL